MVYIKTYILTIFYHQFLVLLIMVPLFISFKENGGSQSFTYGCRPVKICDLGSVTTPIIVRHSEPRLLSYRGAKPMPTASIRRIRENGKQFGTIYQINTLQRQQKQNAILYEHNILLRLQDFQSRGAVEVSGLEDKAVHTEIPVGPYPRKSMVRHWRDCGAEHEPDVQENKGIIFVFSGTHQTPSDQASNILCQ